MGFADKFEPVPAIRPMLNVGCLFDIPTGDYFTGKNGESILNGGVAFLTGLGGRGNTFKSSIAHFMHLRILDRYLNSDGLLYDTEMSATINRMHDLAWSFPRIKDVDLQKTKRLVVTDKVRYTGTEFYDLYKENIQDRTESGKLYTLPFLDENGVFMKTRSPGIVEVDSFSMLSTDSVEKIQDAASAGESERNIEAMRDAGAKTQMMLEMPKLTAMSNVYTILTAHMGDNIIMDPHAPPQKKLTFLKNNVKFKNVPEKFTLLTNNCWYCMSSTLMAHRETKAPEFPRNSDDDLKGNTDLMAVTIMNLRGKSGPTGMPIEIVVSQSQGVLVGLTEFCYIKSMERFGLGGNDRNYYLELLPDVSLSRTTVRGKIDANVQLQRALEITSEMCQIFSLWYDVPLHYVCTAKQLYEDLKARGYDWNVLLNTRGWWAYREFEKDLPPFLSTYDLLKMRVGEYHPYWMPKQGIALATQTEASAATETTKDITPALAKAQMKAMEKAVEHANG